MLLEKAMVKKEIMLKQPNLNGWIVLLDWLARYSIL
jgi:hypothetical protein